MSILRAKVSHIAGHEGVHIVKCDFFDSRISMMSLAINESIMIGAEVALVINPAHVAIARKSAYEVSYANQLPVTIACIKHGTLLSRIILRFYDTTLESIIMRESAVRMGLSEGDDVLALIKASEVSIQKVYHV